MPNIWHGDKIYNVNIGACNNSPNPNHFIWLVVTGGDLLWKKSTAGWLVADVDLFSVREKQCWLVVAETELSQKIENRKMTMLSSPHFLERILI